MTNPVPEATASETTRGQLRRADKIKNDAEIDSFLDGAFCGRTGTVGADGYPYVVPNLFVCHDREIWLHTARVPSPRHGEIQPQAIRSRDSQPMTMPQYLHLE